jgi:peptidoglycan hydrolase-like protein with peptidoglycan-binding domain
LRVPSPADGKPASPSAAAAETPSVPTDDLSLSARVRSQLALPPNAAQAPQAAPAPAQAPSPEPVAAGPAAATVDPRLSGAKDDQAAFQAANEILDEKLLGAPSKPYGAVFGTAPYVQDPANAEMLKLFGAAIAKAPELADTPLAAHVKAGQVGRDDVKAMQEFLAGKGHSVGATGADGLYGPRTHAALTAFLRGDAPSSGEGPTVRQGASGEGVRKLQEKLKELGFDPQGADGQFGPNTLAAIKALQASRGLEVDGIVGPDTWKALGIQVSASEVNAPSVGAPGHNSDEVVQTPDGPMVTRDGKQMRAELAPHWDKMAAAAAQAGIRLSLTSGYRSKAHQQELWDEALQKYGSASAARKWVAPPGTSNHQGGTALDINVNGGVYDWLRANGPKFGFHQPMSWEPWHWEHDI